MEENNKENKPKSNKKTKILIAALIIIIIALAAIIGVLTLGKSDGKGSNGIGILNKKDKDEKSMDEKIKIVADETNEIKYTDYDNGLIKMKIPEGWKVDTIGDTIHYTVKVYNPEKPTCQFFFNLKTEGYNKSQAAKSFQQRYYPNSMFAQNPVIEEETTEGFYKIFNELGPINNTTAFTFPTLTDFTIVENLGANPLGGDILRATFKDESGEEAEGIFTAYVYDAGAYYVNEYVTSGNQIDIYYLNVYDSIFITAPKDEFINWEETLNTISSSLEFTDTFMNQYSNAQDAVMQNFQSVRNTCNQISAGIMDSWAKRSASYDIMSQKQSDATLGYERVYDTDTGEIYKAYNGFTDDYQGEKYQAITDNMYTEKTSGYIEEIGK